MQMGPIKWERRGRDPVRSRDYPGHPSARSWTRAFALLALVSALGGFILVIVVLMLLSGGSTPVESMPRWLQTATSFLPARHFVSFSQVIIYPGGGFAAVWEQVAMVGAIGLAFLVYSLTLFRKSIAVTK